MAWNVPVAEKAVSKLMFLERAFLLLHSLITQEQLQKMFLNKLKMVRIGQKISCTLLLRC